jgi:hypothetical protein
MTSVVTSNEAIREIEQLLYKEASFLDRPDLDSWVELYTDDGTYWMPAIEDQEDPLNHVSLFYDAGRIERLQSPLFAYHLEHPGNGDGREDRELHSHLQFPLLYVLPRQANTLRGNVHA